MKKNLLVLFIYFALAIIVTLPLVAHPGSLVIDPIDALLNTWMLNWIAHSFTSGLPGVLNFYNANIFFPYKYTFAFSDLQLPLGLLSIPFIFITGQPLAANNLTMIIGLALTSFSAYLLVKHLTNRPPVALFSGVLLGFSTIHLNYLAHQQSFNLWPFIFATYFLQKKRYLLHVLFFLVSGLTSPLTIYYLLLIAAIKILLLPTDRQKVMAYTIISGLLISPLLFPYFLVSWQFHYKRPITDAIHFSLQIPDLLNISTTSRLSYFLRPTAGATLAYFGGVFWLLTGVMTAGIFRDRQKFLKSLPREFWLFLIIALTSLILALGPGLHIFRKTVHVGPIPIIPLPYLIFYYLVPGFAGFRTPSRWIILTAFSLVVALAIYFAKRITWKWSLILSALVILEINFPLKYYQVPSVKDFPPEQLWLKDNYQSAPIIQFPIYRWDDPSPFPDPNKILTATTGVGQETLREYYSTIQRHPMYNGYSGFSPKEWEEKVRWLQKDFPSDETISYLRGKGIKLVLAPKDWNAKIASFSALKPIQKFPQTTIYEVL